MSEVPPLLSPAQVGRALRISRRSAKTMLRGARVLEQHESGRWYVDENRLRERLPSVYDRVYLYYANLPEAAGSDR